MHVEPQLYQMTDEIDNDGTQHDGRSSFSGHSHQIPNQNDNDTEMNPDFPPPQHWEQKNKQLRTRSVGSADSDDQYTKDSLSRTGSFDYVHHIISHKR